MQIIFLLLSLSISLFSTELQWVDEKVNSILPDRFGINTKDLDDLKDPFITLNKKNIIQKKVIHTKRRSNYKTKKKHFNLSAIMNKSALINGSWYKLGETIQGYKIFSIKNTLVILRKGKNILNLTTKSKKSSLKILK